MFSEISIYQVKPSEVDTFDPLTRVIKCVKYAHYWELDTEENYGKAQKRLYESYWKAMEKCLIVPHDKLLGEVVG